MVKLEEKRQLYSVETKIILSEAIFFEKKEKEQVVSKQSYFKAHAAHA